MSEELEELKKINEKLELFNAIHKELREIKVRLNDVVK